MPRRQSSPPTALAHEGLIPADYGAFAQACFEKMMNYPTAYCTEADVAEATFAAATEDGWDDPLSGWSRYETPGGAALDDFGSPLSEDDAGDVRPARRFLDEYPRPQDDAAGQAARMLPRNFPVSISSCSD